MLRRLKITLEFSRSTTLPLFHEAQLTAFLLTARTGSDPPDAPRGFWPSVLRGIRQEYAAGAQYGFILNALPAADAEVAQLLAALRSGALPDDPRMAFGAHCRCVRVQCAHSLVDIDTLAQAQLLSPKALSEAWCTRFPDAHCAGKTLRLRWLSPARLLKAAPRPRAGEARFVASEAGIDAAFLWRRVLSSLENFVDIELFSLAAPIARLSAVELFWHTLHYRGTEQEFNPVGGLLGEVLLVFEQDLPLTTLGLLLLAGHMGIGQRRQFGLGQFELLPGALDCMRLINTPAIPALTDPARWRNAWQHCQANSESPDAAEFDAERAAQMAQRIAASTYLAPPLYRFELAKTDGTARVLSVPPFWDRVAQRVVLELITPGLESLANNASFGFRPGRSRQQARDQLLRLQRDGFEVVLESDIDDFFDSIEPWRIAVRLRALFGVDPLLALIAAWISAPVQLVDGSLQIRMRGLPQGAPLSPALANLLLADFDHDLESAGFALVRFADDFVVACKSRMQAEQALTVARQSLSEKGLSLKAAKTTITSFRQGFDFLGYRFTGGLALEVKSKAPIAADATLLVASPATELYADRAFAAFEPVAQRQSAKADAPVEFELPDTAETSPIQAVSAVAVSPSAPGQPAAPAQELGQYLLLAGTPFKLSRDQGRWCVTPTGADSKAAQFLPGEKLAAIVLVGPQHISTGALTYALEIGTPVHFVSSTGRYRGALWPDGMGVDAALWRAQAAHFSKPEVMLRIAKELVCARLKHQRETLRQRNALPANDPYPALLRGAVGMPLLERLRGVEGQGAAVYFQVLQAIVPPDWGFSARVKHPPTDPFNALLSYGYSILYSIANTWIHALGLCPTSAPYHCTHGRHASLASDLMEPLRHLVERVALSHVARAQVSIGDFEPRPAGGLMLKAKPRRDYLAALMDYFGRGELALAPGGEQASRERLPVDEAYRRMLWSLISDIRGSGVFTSVQYR